MSIALLAPNPATSAESTTIEAAEGVLIKKGLRPNPYISKETHQTQSTGIKLQLHLFADPITVQVIAAQTIMQLGLNLQLQDQEEKLEATGTALLLTVPPAKPSGSVTINGENLSGQRLRGGDFHSFQIYLRGDRLNVFSTYFRFKPIGSNSFITKEKGAGLVNFVTGTDSTTGEDSLTITCLIYQSDLLVASSDQEYLYELECDDLLGYKVGIIDSGAFTVYPDAIV